MFARAPPALDRVIDPNDHRPGWIEGVYEQMEPAPRNLVAVPLIAVEHAIVVGEVRCLIEPHDAQRCCDCAL
jgi:hypothetical protein